MSPTNVVRVGVGAFILASAQEDPQNPRFLVGKRLGSHGAGTYALPGGHLEFGEDIEACAAREVLEETGLVVDKVRFLTATNDYMPSEGKHYVTLFVVCERKDHSAEPQVLEPDKCESWEWHSWTDLLGWVEKETRARDGDALVRRLFKPLLDLVAQRPDVRPINA